MQEDFEKFFVFFPFDAKKPKHFIQVRPFEATTKTYKYKIFCQTTYLLEENLQKTGISLRVRKESTRCIASMMR